MDKLALTSLLAIGLGAAASAAAISDGPPRALTNPRSVVSPVNPAAHPISVEQLFKVHDSLGATWSADGRSVIFSADLGGRLNIWRQSIDGGPPVQLTHSEDRQWGAVATRNGKWIIFQSDRAGREIYDLYAVSPKGGDAIDLTNTDDVNEWLPVTSWDSRLVAFQRRVKTEPSSNIGVLDLETRKVRVLTHETDPAMTWQPVAFSRDGHRLIVNRSDLAQSHGAVYSIDLQTGEATRLTPDDGKAYASATDLSPNGRLVALTLQTWDGREQAAVLDLASGKTRFLKPEPWEQSAGRFSPDGHTLLAVTNRDGRDVVYACDVRSGSAMALKLPAGVNSDYFHTLPAFSPQGDRLMFAHQDGSTPLDYWVGNRDGRAARQVTHFGGLPTASLPSTSIVHYRSADGTMISAMLWMPFNLARDGKAPAVVLAHGGPTGQTRDMFDRTATALASRGYIVLAPNPRGSTGYGRAFMLANRGDLGGGDLADEVAGVRFLAATGYVDLHKVGITGGSYGGYMTLMAVSKTPGVWAAAVEEYGIVNWRTMYAHGSPALRAYQAGLIGTPSEDPKVYDADSPLRYLSQVKAPLLVLQGENDIRVPAEEARQLVDFLKKQGDVVDAHFYPTEGHGFSKPEDQADALRRTIAWFDIYLEGKRLEPSRPSV